MSSILIYLGEELENPPNPPKSVPQPAAFVHPRLAKPAQLVVSNNNQFFFLKSPNFGLGFAGAAASAAIHSWIFVTSHVI